MRMIFAVLCCVLLNGCQSQAPPVTQSASKPVIKQPVPSPTIPRDQFRPVQYRIYLPQSDGAVKLKIEENQHLQYRDRNDDSERLSIEAATETVRRLLKKSPQSFPPNTRIVRGFKTWGGNPTITFNQAFANARWWKNEKRAKVALAAIVYSALETQDSIWPTSDDYSLTFLIENKTVGNLGKYRYGVPTFVTPSGNIEIRQDGFEVGRLMHEKRFY